MAFFGMAALLFIGCQDDDLLAETSNPLEENLREQLFNLYGNSRTLVLPDSDSFSDIPADPNNPLTAEKVALGKFLFHETALAIDPKLEAGRGTYSCSSCHIADAGFQSGRKQGIAEGGMGFGFKGENRIMNPEYHPDSVDVQPIRVPTIVNAAYQQVMLWNGQFGARGVNVGTEANWTEGTPKATNHLGFEGLETQAIAGLTVHRMRIDTAHIKNGPYKELFDQAFPETPESERYSLTNAGLSIASYVRTVMASEAPFQKMLKGEPHTMTDEELQGGALFYGKAQCYQCHSGPGMNGMEFHALGMNDLAGEGIIGEVDDGTKRGRGGFTNNPQDDFKFKTPPLYNLRDVEFFGHGGSFRNVREVVVYKNNGQPENPGVPGSQLAPAFKPLGLNEQEINQLTAFLENALYDPDLSRYVPDATPLGSCFPNADSQSMSDLGCN